MATENLVLHADYPSTDKTSASAYKQLVIDLLEGEHTAFLRFDEVEWAWRIIDPVLKAWEHGEPVPYPAGTDGPDCQEHVLENGHSWRSFEGDPIPSHA